MVRRAAERVTDYLQDTVGERLRTVVTDPDALDRLFETLPNGVPREGGRVKRSYA